MVAVHRELDEPAAVFVANRVVACTPTARSEGVSIGLRRREAQRRCPTLRVFDRDPAAEARAFEAVVVALEDITPRVELLRPGTGCFATHGPARYFGGDDALAARTRSVAAGALAGRGWVRIGVADGPFAAQLAARRSPEFGELVVPPGEASEFLDPLPVSTLGAEELVDVLLRLGVATLGDLARLPASDVVGRFGRDGERVHRLARGLDPRPLAAGDPPPDLEVVMELDPPVDRVDRLAFAGKMLADELLARLEARAMVCVQVLIGVESEHGEERARLWRGEGALSATDIAERVRWQLDGWMSGPPSDRPTGGLTRLLLQPDELAGAQGRQLGFWGGRTAADEGAARVVARLQAMLGPEAVQQPADGGGRGPDQQLVLVPVGTGSASVGGGSDGGASSSEVSPWPGRVPRPLPARIHRLVVEVHDRHGEAVAVDGRGRVSAPPHVVRFGNGTRATVTAWAGPWPVDERWWDPTGHRRQARFQLVATDGRAWLAAIESGRWTLTATYD